VQRAFYFDQTRCIGCHTCVVACKDWHDLPAELVYWRRVSAREEGKFPNVKVSHLSVSCNHCERPLCAEACPEDAITKRESDGVVLIDAEACTGCRTCESACPYGAIQFRSDDEDAVAEKCNFCVDRLDRGEVPVCVASCPMRALDCGPLDELSGRPGVTKQTRYLPDPAQTGPALLVKQK
jgi:anaerobic dimethyl sulfoxide reductase subunit B (iron-sulfur subunit)